MKKLTGLKAGITIFDIEQFLRVNYAKFCKDLETRELSIENQNWLHGELALANEMIVTFFNKN